MAAFRLLRCAGLLCLCFPQAAPARPDERHGGTRTTGWSGQIGSDYDQSRSRTSSLRAGFEVEWGNPQGWINLGGDLYGDPSGGVSLRDDGYVTLGLGWALYRNNDRRFYLNAMLDADPHSLTASRGWDLTPSLGMVRGLTEDWWIGGDLSAVLATRADEGSRTGYASLSLWLTWLCGFTASGTDTLSLGVWSATNEIPGDDNSLFAELEYTFDLTDSLEAKLGVGTDPVSPWDHLGVYLSAGLTWHF